MKFGESNQALGTRASQEAEQKSSMSEPCFIIWSRAKLHQHPPLDILLSSLLNQCSISWIMGCVKSKCNKPTQNSSTVEKVDGQPGTKRGEKAVLVYSETGPDQDTSRVNPVLLDYAQRLSEEIVARAVQQWAEVDSRYSDIPYIECDVP
ncbi:hypothetical protein KOW79_004780 [Hemibagrus wyckioides]|uniref:Small membrane A-kinase anchor protein n=1 Tax=Hemibagrus wyckioides TaxID=337641 RepID=A0A9D3NYD9_9TELE|nr:hypothetical protein KOW79_004780 [Hemibagrus wyckioides]